MASLPKEIKSAIKAALRLVLVLILVIAVTVNPMGSRFVMSVNSQEFFSYHMKDLLDYFAEDAVHGASDYYLSTGTYEQDLPANRSILTDVGAADKRAVDADGELFGAAKGKNLIVIQLESMQNMLIGREYNGQELTPNLNALIREQGTLYFDNYYQQIGSGNTSDAEFATNNSMLGTVESYTYQLYENNYFRGLPWLLKEQGYSTAVMHGYEKEFWNRENVYPTLGFDQFYSSDEFGSDNIEGLGGGRISGISDHAFYEQSVDYLQQMEQSGQPFYSFLISLSSHNPFHLPDSLKTISLAPEDEDTIFGNYLAAANYADECLGRFIEELKNNGLYDSSLIAMYGDHFGLSKSDDRIEERVSQWLGYEYDYDTMMNIPLLIHVPESQRNETISISGGQLDFMPTIAYLLGIPQLDTLYLGQNLLTAASGFVAQETFLLKGSFIKDDIVFEISRDGVFEKSRAWNRKTRKEVDIGPYEADSKRAKELVELSLFYLNQDVLRQALLEGKNINEIVEVTEIKPPKGETLPMIPLITNENLKTGILPKTFYRWMERKQTTDTVLLTTANLVSVLTSFESDFSGRSGSVGAIKYVDDEVNKRFRQIKGRILPVVKNMEDFTKVEYLGYDKILYMPDLKRYTVKQILDFISINEPYGLALSTDDLLSCGRTFLNAGVTIYVYDADTPVKRAMCYAAGAVGFIDEQNTLY